MKTREGGILRLEHAAASGHPRARDEERSDFMKLE
jgi:hypothetical protein